MDLKKLAEYRNELLLGVGIELEDNGIPCRIHGEHPFLAYVTDNMTVGRMYCVLLGFPPEEDYASLLFKIRFNKPYFGEDMPFGVRASVMLAQMGILQDVMGLSENQAEITCVPEEIGMIKHLAAARVLCDARSSDPPFLLSPVRTCQPPESRDLWTTKALLSHRRASETAMDDIGNWDDFE